LGREEKQAVCRLMDSGQIGQGKKVDEFEILFADYVGSKYAVATSCCTSALFLSLKVNGIGEGHRVLVPSITFAASAHAIVHAGATPIFVDVRKRDLCMDLDNNISGFDAVMNVHLYGQVNNMIGNRKIIDDSAHLLINDCYLGHTQAFSFHPTKNITTGFGGMIATDNQEHYEWLKKARIHGIDYAQKERRWGYDVQFPGWKMNMSDLQAVIGIEQLKKLYRMNSRRQFIVDIYNRRLGYERVGLHLYSIFVKDRQKFMVAMEAAGIQCSVHFEPLHKMTAYKKEPRVNALPISDWVGRHIVSLPLFPDLELRQAEYICEQVLKTNQLMPDCRTTYGNLPK
jgi:dTDP-4-amino-4,6-dideoxygalactose transaminase